MSDSLDPHRRALLHPAREVVLAYCGALLRDRGGARWGTLCHFDMARCQVPTADIALLEALTPAIYEAAQSRSDHEAD